jgi:F-type H+-transporting ATPase subunit delta
VFHADRWAAAFVGALDSKAEEGFTCLKKLSEELRPIGAVLFGRSAASSIEETLSQEFIVQKDHSGGNNIEHEYPICFICLLIEKNLFRKIDLIIAKIEKLLDKRNGVLEALVETAEDSFSGDGGFEDQLAKMIQSATGAARIKMHTRVVPELLAGYRLRIGELCVDASLKNQIAQMTADLTAAR